MPVFSFLRVFRPNRHWQGPLLGLLSVLIVALLLLGLRALGRWSRNQLHSKESFQIAFSDIDCTSLAS